MRITDTECGNLTAIPCKRLKEIHRCTDKEKRREMAT